MRVWRCWLQNWDGIVEMEYQWMKIRFGVQKHKTVIVVLLCGFGLMALIYYGVRGMIPKMPMDEGSFSALLGTLVGGFFSLAGSVGVAKMQQKAQKEVLRKNTIYKPLYDELIKNDRMLTQESPYPRSIKLNNERLSFEPALQFCIWTKIKDDSRFLEMPEAISKRMIELQQLAEDFIEVMRTAVIALDECWKESQIKFGIEPADYSSMSEWEIAIILETDKESVLKKLKRRLDGLRENYDVCVVRDFYDTSRKNAQILEVDKIRKLYLKKQKEMIEILAGYIRYIDSRYEG
mgnify:FL=1|jgi:hypothetical protein